MRLALSRRLLEATFAQLRECGEGRRECVTYWSASIAEPTSLRRVVHPAHQSGWGGYAVDSEWVSEFFLDLRARRETVMVQVHTHPRSASHSSVDDRFALAPAAGFLSLVLPNFATGPVTLEQAHLVEMQGTGEWSPVTPEEVFDLE